MPVEEPPQMCLVLCVQGLRQVAGQVAGQSVARQSCRT